MIFVSIEHIPCPYRIDIYKCWLCVRDKYCLRRFFRCERKKMSIFHEAHFRIIWLLPTTATTFKMRLMTTIGLSPIHMKTWKGKSHFHNTITANDKNCAIAVSFTLSNDCYLWTVKCYVCVYVRRLCHENRIKRRHSHCRRRHRRRRRRHRWRSHRQHRVHVHIER